MADDDTSTIGPISGPRPDPGTEADPSQPGSDESEEASKAPPPTQAELDADKKEGETIRQGMEGINKSLNELEQRRGQWEERWNSTMKPYVESVTRGLNAPIPPPPELPTDPPPPPTVEQHHDGAEAVVNAFKFLALLGIAYGISARRGGTVRKAALAGAIEGWAEAVHNNSEQGKKQRDEAYQLWEKQREFDRDERKRQLDEYHAVLNDRHLKLADQMSMIGLLANENKDYKTEEAAKRQSLLDLSKELREKWNVHKAAEEQHRKDRPKVEGMIGKSGEAQGYYSWLEKNFGVLLNSNDPVEKEHALPPNQQYSAYDAWYNQKKLDEDLAKRKAELPLEIEKEKAMQKARDEQKKEDEDEAPALTPGGPMTDAQKKKLNQTLFSLPGDEGVGSD